MEKMFEKATRLKLRFTSPVGSLSVEDLWDLPLTSKNKVNLDDIAIQVNRLIKDKKEESFVCSVKTDEVNELRLEIIKHIISVRMEENKAKLEATQKAEQKAKIREVLAKKQDDALNGLSVEELEAMLNQ